MAKGNLTAILRQLRRVVVRPAEGGLTDAQLLERFAAQRDEAAFEVLLWRHGPMVLGVGRRMLGNLHDAEDVLQATFLALVRQAGSISRRGSVGSWLYKVAYRTALRARMRQRKHADSPTPIEEVPASSPVAERAWSNVLPLLDEELQRLPEKYRTPLMLCYLQGLTNQEAAEQLGCPIGTVFTRLARGRSLLHGRLARRGVTLSAGLLGTVLAQNADAAPLPLGLVQATVRAAVRFAAGSTAGALSPHVLALTEGVLKMLWLTKLKALAVTLLLLAVVGSGGGLLAFRALAREPGDAAKDADAAKPAEAAPKLPREALRYGGKTFDEWRTILMTDLKPEVRTEAIKALSTLGARGYGPEAAAAIVEAARDYDYDRSTDASELKLIDAARPGLSKIGADAVPILIEEVKKGKTKDRRFALHALGSIGVAAKAALPVVLEALQEEDPAIRAPAIGAARALDSDGTSAPAVAQALTSNNAEIRYHAIEALDHFKAKAKSETPRLITVILQDSKSNNRYRAIDALFHINPEAKTVVPVLKKALKDEDPQVRLQATDYLGKLGPDAAEAVPDLIAILKEPRLNPGEALWIARALGNIGPAAKAAVPTLTGLLGDGLADHQVEQFRDAMMQALKNINK